MSIFNEPNNPEPQGEQQGSNPESFVAKLAAERGDTWNDPEVIAKGKIEADNHIKDLERQLEEMREDLGKQDYASQLLDQLQGKAPDSTKDPVVSNNDGSTPKANTQPEVSEDVLKSLVEKTLTERDSANTKQQNVDLVSQRMTEKYGTEAQAIVTAKAKDLGMTTERMEELASESPTAFLTLIGEPAGAAPVNMTRGSINTSGLGQASTERDASYYSKMRKENRSQYYTPKIQQQMMDDAKRLGSNFGR